MRGTALQLREELSGSEDLVFCGDGALRYAAQLTTGPGWSVAGEELASPPVASLAVLAVEGMLEGHSLQPAELAPLYLREADARINWTTRHDAPSERKA